MDCGGSLTGTDSLSRCLGGDKANGGFVNEMIESSGGVAATSHACNHVVGSLTAYLVEQLPAYFLRNARLKPRHHLRVGMRPDGAPDYVEAVGVAAPVADGLIGCIFAAARRRCVPYIPRTPYPSARTRWLWLRRAVRLLFLR